MHDPRSGHLEVVYRILRYLKRSPKKGFMFKSHGHLNVEGYCDADWASCVDDRQHLDIACLLEETWCHGKARNNRLYLNQLLKLNIEPWH
jgi:hypothetical protein